MGELQKLFIGEKLTVRVLPGRGGKPIGRLQDGRVILFDQDNPYWSILAPGQSVECHVIVISENYIIVDPISEPEAAVIVHYPEEDFPDIDVDDIVKDLEKMMKKVKGKNAEIVPRALLRIIQLEQLIIKILKGG
ncbi:unnamed protein product [marine sediment metagenome]|uniref:TRAM domain-containing protein n=1 Tax=marine sediment metagenome TaxID=412755 RepID=X1EVA0_9ZZZZ